MDNNVGSIVYFTDNEIQVFVMPDAETEFGKIYGYCLLVSEYFSRLYATVTRDVNAKRILIDTLNDVNSYEENLSLLVQSYANFYRLGSVNLRYGLGSQQPPKRHIVFTSVYNLEGNYTSNFKPHGFGLLGKNVEVSSATACLATLDFILKEYESNEDASNIIKHTVYLTAINIYKYPKLGIKNEVAVVRQVMVEIKQKINAML